uniref:LRRNT domain-containing protein n=1 Tax=Strongyloides stercoralis TaxID=6248 RepID=A0A0K0E6I2_STRER
MIIYLLIVFIFSLTSCKNITKCLNDCDCDNVEEIIHCHKMGLKSLTLPKNPLKNYKVIRLTDNDIEYLPSEEMLKKKFPQLEGIDVEGNSNFECQSIPYYRKITIFSDCNDNGVIVSNNNETTTTSQKPNVALDEEESCDLKCTISKKAHKLADYAKYYWNKLLEKLRKFNKENKTWNEIKGAFNSFREALEGVF